MKHFNELTQQNINTLKIGEHFTYKVEEVSSYNNYTGFKQGLKVDFRHIIPIGLLCSTREGAQKQS